MPIITCNKFEVELDDACNPVGETITRRVRGGTVPVKFVSALLGCLTFVLTDEEKADLPNDDYILDLVRDHAAVPKGIHVCKWQVTRMGLDGSLIQAEAIEVEADGLDGDDRDEWGE